jgi:transposase-like protein
MSELEKAQEELRRQHAEIAELREALKEAGLFLHHAWCDVQMNEYSFEKLNKTMEVVDATLAQGEKT